jgi:hypothetical protein
MRPTELAAQLQAAYDKVKEWPENSETGFMDLLALRNLVPDAIAALTAALAVEAEETAVVYRPTYQQIKDTVTANIRRMQEAGESHLMMARWLSADLDKLYPPALTPASSAVEGEAVAWLTPYYENDRAGKLVPVIVPVESVIDPKEDWTPLYRLPASPAPHQEGRK